jgi:hypothetical protein
MRSHQILDLAAVVRLHIDRNPVMDAVGGNMDLIMRLFARRDTVSDRTSLEAGITMYWHRSLLHQGCTSVLRTSNSVAARSMLQAVRAGVLPCREIWMMMCNQAHIWIGCEKYLLQSKVHDRYHADSRRQQVDFCDILPTALRPVRAGWRAYAGFERPVPASNIER